MSTSCTPFCCPDPQRIWICSAIQMCVIKKGLLIMILWFLLAVYSMHSAQVKNRSTIFHIIMQIAFGPSTIVPRTTLLNKHYSTPGCQRTARLEFLDFLRTFLAGKLKIRTKLERRSSTPHSGYKTAVHCFHDRR